MYRKYWRRLVISFAELATSLVAWWMMSSLKRKETSISLFFEWGFLRALVTCNWLYRYNNNNNDDGAVKYPLEHNTHVTPPSPERNTTATSIGIINHEAHWCLLYLSPLFSKIIFEKIYIYKVFVVCIALDKIYATRYRVARAALLWKCWHHFANKFHSFIHTSGNRALTHLNWFKVYKYIKYLNAAPRVKERFVLCHYNSPLFHHRDIMFRQQKKKEKTFFGVNPFSKDRHVSHCVKKERAVWWMMESSAWTKRSRAAGHW